MQLLGMETKLYQFGNTDQPLNVIVAVVRTTKGSGTESLILSASYDHPGTFILVHLMLNRRKSLEYDDSSTSCNGIGTDGFSNDVFQK